MAFRRLLLLTASVWVLGVVLPGADAALASEVLCSGAVVTEARAEECLVTVVDMPILLETHPLNLDTSGTVDFHLEPLSGTDTHVLEIVFLNLLILPAGIECTMIMLNQPWLIEVVLVTEKYLAVLHNEGAGVPAYEEKCPLHEVVVCEMLLSNGEEDYAFELAQGVTNIKISFLETEEMKCTNGEVGLLGMGGELPSSAGGLGSSLS
jgi:hypothetical protein